MKSLRNLRGGVCPRCQSKLAPSATGRCDACSWSERTAQLTPAPRRHTVNLRLTWSAAAGWLLLIYGVVAAILLVGLVRTVARESTRLATLDGPDGFAQLLGWVMSLGLKVGIAVIALMLPLTLLPVTAGIGQVMGKTWGRAMTHAVTWAMIIAAAACVFLAPTTWRFCACHIAYGAIVLLAMRSTAHATKL